jgi:hypothetical protein
MKLLFKTTINNLIHMTFMSEKDEALEIIMDDAFTFLMRATILQSQILPGIYPIIFSLHLYPELRECAVQDAMSAFRINKENQLSVMQ